MILIVGITGVLGSETARQLLAAGQRIRGLTRNPANAADLQALGAEIVQGDLIDKASLVRACQGVDAVLACAHQLMGTGKYSSQAVDDEGHRALIDAAKAAGVKHFVYTSIQNASPTHPTDFIRTKSKIEAYLTASGLSYTILRPSAFMEWHVHNLLGATILTTGKTTIFGGGNNPTNFIAARDVAHIAVIALTDASMRNRIIEMGGPDNLTKNQIAEMYGRLSGKKPKVTNVPTGVMKVMAPILRPFQPVISRLMTLSVWGDTTDQTFDCTETLKEFPMTMTRVEEFVRAQVERSQSEQKVELVTTTDTPS
ncbi:MAG TPA: NmrA family NAD(P)-binding protein [Anaerolineales bacterium]|nr:NmrA family NAD(P)-binding protein [Anaerolineales bacterium]